MKRDAPEHRKVRLLARMLDVEIYGAVGVLELLWHWTARAAPAGDVGCFGASAIADAVGWRGDAEALVEALVEAGWLDRGPACGLFVHDWADHADDAVHVALARAGRRFADGTAPRMSRLSRAERQKIAGRGVLEAEAPRGKGATAKPRQKPAKRMPGIPAPDAFSAEEQAALETWCREAHPEMLEELPRIAAKILDWGRAKGEVRPGWVATVRNAVRAEADRRRERAKAGTTRGLPEQPVERAKRGGQASLF